MRIIKRNKYYYLIHSYRIDGKVATLELYLGGTLPKTITSQKEELYGQCWANAFFPRFEVMKNAFQKDWQRYPKSIQQKILTELSVDFTYNTNAIEGSTLTHEEVEELIQKNIAPHKSLADISEAVQHSKVFLTICQDAPTITSELLLHWHKKLFTETKTDIAGVWRDYGVRVGFYIAPDWQDVPELIKEFIQWYRKNEMSMNPVELAARAHYRFEMIHPFGDGNGRIGRLIIATILAKFQYPLLIIENAKKQAYYKALQKEESDFGNYFFCTYQKAHKNLLNK